MQWFIVGLMVATALVVFTAWFRDTTLGDLAAEIPSTVAALGRMAKRGWRFIAPDARMDWRQLEKRAAKVLRRQVKPSIIGKRVVPAVCTIALSPRDYLDTVRAHRLVVDHLGSWLAALAQRRGWEMAGGVPTIRIEQDAAVPDGELLCRTGWKVADAAMATAVARPAATLAGPLTTPPTMNLQAPTHPATSCLRLVGDGIDLRVRASDRVVLIGRSRRCQARLVDPSVSAVHTELRWDGHDWILTDRDSTNGTWIDGRRITTLPLAGASRVRVGAVTLQVSDERHQGER